MLPGKPLQRRLNNSDGFWPHLRGASATHMQFPAKATLFQSVSTSTSTAAVLESHQYFCVLQPNACFKTFSLLSGSSPSFPSWFSPAFHFSRSPPCNVSAAGHILSKGVRVDTAGRLLPMCLLRTWLHTYSWQAWTELSSIFARAQESQ